MTTTLFLRTALLALIPITLQAQPLHVYLTWQGDTSTTITVNYHTPSAEPSQVYYDTLAHDGDVAAYAFAAKGTAHQIKGTDGRWIHWVELRGLEPGRAYYFIAGSKDGGFSAERKLRTVPADSGPLRFVSGGDMEVTKRARDLLKQAALVEPRFALLGGDLAYVDGERSKYAKWDRWFDNWERLMVTPEGYTVPMVLAIGNHEVQGGYDGGVAGAPFFLRYFAQAGESSYFTRRFGSELAVLVMDSGHAVEHGGAQTAWLMDQLEQIQDLPYRFALYHVPLYPGYRSFGYNHSVAGRRHWLPLFDRYKLTTAFENHDHLLKRTKLLRGGKVDAEGTLYLGDGCMGKKPRADWFWLLRWLFTSEVGPFDRWYLEKSEGVGHFWQVDLLGGGRGVEYRAVDERGRVVDVYGVEHK